MIVGGVLRSASRNTVSREPAIVKSEAAAKEAGLKSARSGSKGKRP